jgi:hypothetical protein
LIATAPSIADCRRGGRTWWAHFTITRVNLGSIILRNQVEELMEILQSASSSGAF